MVAAHRRADTGAAEEAGQEPERTEHERPDRSAHGGADRDVLLLGRPVRVRVHAEPPVRPVLEDRHVVHELQRVGAAQALHHPLGVLVSVERQHTDEERRFHR